VVSLEKREESGFHYFAHNLHALCLAEAEEIIKEIITVMQSAIIQTQLKREENNKGITLRKAV